MQSSGLKLQRNEAQTDKDEDGQAALGYGIRPTVAGARGVKPQSKLPAEISEAGHPDGDSQFKLIGAREQVTLALPRQDSI